MALINPRQVEHLKKLQTGFRFKERTIVVSTVATGSAHAGAGGGGVMGAATTGMDAFSIDDLGTAKTRSSFFGTPREGSAPGGGLQSARASFNQTTAIAAAAAAAAAAIAAMGSEKPGANPPSQANPPSSHTLHLPSAMHLLPPTVTCRR